MELPGFAGDPRGAALRFRGAQTPVGSERRSPLDGRKVWGAACPPAGGSGGLCPAALGDRLFFRTRGHPNPIYS